MTVILFAVMLPSCVWAVGCCLNGILIQFDPGWKVRLVVAARTADVAVCNTSSHRTFLPSVLVFKTIPSHYNFGEVAWEGGSLSWQQITGKGKSGASMDAVLTSPGVTKLDCKSTIPICPGTVFTVKNCFIRHLGAERCCRISQYSGYQNVLPNLYFSVSSTLVDRLNPVCHFISYPVFLAAL
jgi:hypothetical protein